jgi:cyclase
MIRSLLVTALAFAIIFAGGCAKRDLDKTGLITISKHVYAFIATGPTPVEGHGANSGFVVGSNGVLVVDSRYTPALAEDLLRAIRSVTSAPIRYVVDTSYHPDHAWGNSVFKAQGATIIARPETREALLTYSPVYLDFYREHSKEGYDLIKDVTIVPPDTIFNDGETIDLGGVKVVLRYFGPAHTAGDAVVLVRHDGVLFTGGLAANGYHLNMADPGADYDNWLRTLDRLGDLKVRYVVPGRGEICGKADLETDKSYIKTLIDTCVADIRRIVPAEKAMATIAIPGTEGYLQSNLLPFNIQSIYTREIPNVVRPEFAFAMPPAIGIVDGGGDTKLGTIRWFAQIKDGAVEIQAGWRTSSRPEVIRQDIADRVAESNVEGTRDMKIEGYMKLEVGGEQAPAAYGTWTYTKLSGQVGKGRWVLALMLRGGKLYAIHLSTDSGGDAAKEKANMDLLEKIAATFKLTGTEAPKAPA